MKTTTTTLIRMLRAGEVLSFDQGRIKVELVEKTGRTARLRLILGETVVVDKPRVAANDLRGSACESDPQGLVSPVA
ncbi:hypothetical protein D3C87_1392670 [compost metagenome]